MSSTKQITIFSGVVVHNGKVLLTMRNEPECPGAHLKWEIPGGKVDFGETPEESIVREFEEETGRKVKVKKLLPWVGVNYWDYDWGKQQTLCFVYLLELVEDKEPVEKDHHVEKIEWVDINKVDYENSLPLMKEILEIGRKEANLA